MCRLLVVDCVPLPTLSICLEAWKSTTAARRLRAGQSSHQLGGIGGSLVSIHDNQICPYHTKVTLDHFANFGEIYVKNGSNVTINNNDIGTTCLAVTGSLWDSLR